MPMIYQAACSHCSHSEHFSDQVLAVILEFRQPRPDDICSPNNYPELAYLPHPGEARTLEKLGLTLEAASREHRLVAITTRLCKSCGSPYQRYRLKPWEPFWSCLLMPIVGLASGVAGMLVSCAFSTGCFAGALVSFIPMMALSWYATLRMHWQFPERVALYDGKQCCPNCGSADTIRPTSFAWRSLKCPQCHSQSLKVHAWGIS